MNGETVKIKHPGRTPDPQPFQHTAPVIFLPSYLQPIEKQSTVWPSRPFIPYSNLPRFEYSRAPLLNLAVAARSANRL
jgi:hypothetical protein